MFGTLLMVAFGTKLISSTINSCRERTAKTNVKINKMYTAETIRSMNAFDNNKNN